LPAAVVAADDRRDHERRHRRAAHAGPVSSRISDSVTGWLPANAK
jgi:hypothetical protein